MPVPINDSAIPGRHHIRYRVRDSHSGDPVREVEVLATPEEIEAFARDGYLVRKSLIPMSHVELLREALAETLAKDDRIENGGGRDFGGVFLRHLMDKHPAFLDFLDFPPAVSVARAVFGPYVQSRGFTARICFADNPNQETTWHFHQRLVPDPIPPLFSRPQSLDVLLYLDDVDADNGPLCVAPGSHLWLDRDLPRSDFEDKPGQVVLELPAGSVVLAHGSLWHRALPTRPGSGQRRLLLFGYGPTWMKPSIYGKQPEDGLTARLLRQPGLSDETKELLGVAGFM